MRMQSAAHPPTPQVVTWTVRGPGWAFVANGDRRACPTEMATRAVEKVWRDDEEESWKHAAGDADGVLHPVNGGRDLPTVGIALEVSHDLMDNRDQHIIVPSCLALANAGFHGDAERLRREWERASEEAKLAALVDLLGED